MRATTAPSEGDRKIALHLDAAARELESALRVARSVKTASTVHRARKTVRDLENLLSGLEGVRSITPRSGADPDLLPEEERIRLHREKMAREREEREAKRRLEVTSGE